jgi:hypothetical protein
MASRYFVEEAMLEHCHDETKALWSTNLRSFTPAAVDAKLELGYRTNPAGQGVILVLRVHGETSIVGVQGVHPRTMHLGPTLIRAANLADFAVAPEHRTLGPALTLMKYAITQTAAPFDLLYGLPNAKSAAVCIRAGLKRVGSIQRHAKPLRSRKLMARHMPTPLAGALAPWADLGLRLMDAWRSQTDGTRLVCRVASFDDSRLDTLWAGRRGDLLLSERSSAMLRWRYATAGRGPWQISIASAPDNTPVGYVVWRLEDGTASVGDFFCVEPRTQTTALVLAFAAQARTQGADVVSLLFFGTSEVSTGLRRAGFAVRGENALVYVGHASRALAAVDPERHWYSTGFDNDAD